MISSPAAVIGALAGISSGFFILEKRTGWKVFQLFPPLLWIYAVPVLLNNLGVLPKANPAYDFLDAAVLPSFLVLLLISVDIGTALRVMGRGVAVMLVGSAGIVLGGVASYALVRGYMDADAWKIFGGLAGAWTGGTGNMAAVAGGLELDPEGFGLAVLADSVVYTVWLPLLLGSKNFSERFNRWARVDPERIKALEDAAQASLDTPRAMEMHDAMYLIAVVAGVVFSADTLSHLLPVIDPVLSTSTWRTLLITTLSVGLSFTKLRTLPGSRNIGLALVYLYLAGVGAKATLSGLEQAPVFLAAAFLWIVIHGGFCLLGAKLLRVDIHTAAIASAANIGGVATAPIVASHHREALVPASILMALIGYAAGNYLAILTAQLCSMLAP